jgi:uncharacterized protein
MRPSPRFGTTLLVAVLSLTGPGGAQQTPAADSAAAAARRLLELTGAADVAVREIEAMVPVQRQANPQIPAAFWDAVLAHARHDIPQLMDSLMAIYAAHFTPAELEALVRFYESPLGRRVAEVQPLINQESIQAGRRWGEAIGRAIGDSLVRAGVTGTQER